MKCILKTVGTGCLLTLSAIDAQSQSSPAVDWSPPYTDNKTLGGKLQPYFADVLNECGISNLEYQIKKNKNAPLSPIPKILQKDLKLDQRVWSQDDNSIARLFAFAYPSKDIESNKQVWGDDNKLFYTNDFTTDPALMLPSGRSNVVYSHNCTGIINAAANASTGISLPVASLKSALNSQYNGSSRQLIAISNGLFNSPFSLALNSGSASVDRFSALSTLWDWYAKHPTEATRVNYFIKSFNGVALFQVMEKTQEKDGKLSLSGGYNSPFASLDTNVKAAISDINKISVNKYMTAAYLDNAKAPMIIYDILPGPDAINRMINGYSLQLVSGYHSTLVAGGSASFKQRIAGLPNELAQKDYWKVSLQDLSLGSLKIVDVTNIGQGKDKVTEFSFSFSPNPTKIDLSQLDLKFSISTKTSVNAVNMTLQTEPVVFSTSRSPEVAERSYIKQFVTRDTGGGNTAISWDIYATVIDEEDVLDWSKTPSPVNVQIIRAAPLAPLIITPSVTYSRGDQAVKISMTYLAEPSDNLDFSATTQSTMLKVTGSLKFFKKPTGNSTTGVSVLRALPSSCAVVFPGVKQVALAPVPPANQGNTTSVPGSGN